MFTARIVTDSLHYDSACMFPRLTTMEVVTWKPIVAEFNTHRVFTRNSASSRAIPIKRLIEQITNRPYIPHFCHNQSGMQPADELSEKDMNTATQAWLQARDNALRMVHALDNLDVHKQWVNRLLEPWMETTILVTSTQWDNFFALRCNPMAQHEIRLTAEAMRMVLNNSTPVTRQQGEWHVPYMNREDTMPDWELKLMGNTYSQEVRDHLTASAGRCATVSYDNLGTGVDREKDIKRAEGLLKAGHWSPFEHQAQCIYKEQEQRCGNFVSGWMQFRKTFQNEAVFQG